MVDHIIEERVVIGRARPEVFAFLAEGAGQRVGAGAVLDYRVTCLGLPFAWRAFVREFDPPFRFLDVQLRGPFARWEHRHRFLAHGDATLMEDRLVYRLPLGLVGWAAHAVALRHLMAAAWRCRRQRIGELVGPVSSPQG